MMGAPEPLHYPAAGASSRRVHTWHDGVAADGIDTLAEEVPVALEFNGISHAVMLTTPLDLEDFALGFALSEGIVDTSKEVFDIQLETGCAGITVKLEIAASRFARLKEMRRNLTGRTGCGLCGTESLAHAVRPLHPLAHPRRLSAGAIAQALAGLRQHQTLQQATGATHAAAWCDDAGAIRLLREDVGRHNALDKLIGATLASRPAELDGFVVVTSRASMEMVQKAVTAGFSSLVAISAPTRLAVDLAEQAGLCLVGFARPERWVAYSHAERIDEPGDRPLTRTPD
ncbi:MAG: formate dehydrogenase accessory sulfurtransferase FdhD [Pseudogulbenkiania sp.]|nr:formate dehydrogenase accessory sulfurtransferase FdhD [Pseudogulbenkiania sp.]